MLNNFGSVVLYVAIPAGVFGLLFWHELGHALPILLTGGRAHIIIGSRDGRTVTLGRLVITVGIDGLWSFFTYGTIQWSEVNSESIQGMAILGGPLATAGAIGALSFGLLRGVDGPLRGVLVYFLVIEGYRIYQTVVPKTYSRGPYEGLPSDGKRFLQLIQS